MDYQSHNNTGQAQAYSILPPSERNKRTNQDNSYDSTVATKRARMPSNSQDSGTSDGDRSGSSEQPTGLEIFHQQIQILSSQNEFERFFTVIRSAIDFNAVLLSTTIVEKLKSLIIEHGKDNVPADIVNHFWMNGDTSKSWPYYDDVTISELAQSNDIEKFLWECINHKARLSSLEEEKYSRKKLHDAFQQNYEGEAANWFYDAISDYEAMYEPTRHYGRVIVCLQSSGYGKTRGIFELMKREFVIYVCIREDELARSGWPPGDTPVWDFLSRQEKAGTYKGEELAAAFLGALFEVADALLEESEDVVPSEFAKRWEHPTTFQEEYSESKRYQLFHKICERTVQMLDEAQRTPCFREGDNTLRNLSDIRQYDRVQWCKVLYEQFCGNSVKKLNQLLATRGYKRFFIAFDECSGLGQHVPSKREGYMTLTAMRRIMKAGETSKSIWYILCDTTFTMSDLVLRKGPDAPSARLDSRLEPLPPWSFYGFNHMLRPRLRNGTPSPLGACTFEHLKMYGRSYWSTIEDGEFNRAAQQKLLRGNVFNPKNENHVLAVFSNRVLVELAESEASTRLAVDGVRSHMRTLMGIIDRSTIVSTVKSEPPLAIAAAYTLCRDISLYNTALESFISKLILQGLVIDTGTKGELVSRMLWILARDAVYLGNPGVVYREHAADKGVVPVTLRTILEKLLGDEIAPSASRTDETLSNLRTYAEGVYVNFTHFMKVTNILDVVTAEFLYSLWCRGAAVQCAEGQPIFDGLFVTYGGDLMEPFDAKRLSYVIWQTKARVASASSSLEEELTGPAIEGGTGVWMPEYVAIVMDLCTTAKFKTNNGYRKISYSPAKRPGAYKLSKRPLQESSRYCINIRGCNYQVLNSPFRAVPIDDILSRLSGVSKEFGGYALEFCKQLNDMEDPTVRSWAGVTQ